VAIANFLFRQESVFSVKIRIEFFGEHSKIRTRDETSNKETKSTQPSYQSGAFSSKHFKNLHPALPLLTASRRVSHTLGFSTGALILHLMS